MALTVDGQLRLGTHRLPITGQPSGTARQAYRRRPREPKQRHSGPQSEAGHKLASYRDTGAAGCRAEVNGLPTTSPLTRGLSSNVYLISEFSDLGMSAVSWVIFPNLKRPQIMCQCQEICIPEHSDWEAFPVGMTVGSWTWSLSQVSQLTDRAPQGHPLTWSLEEGVTQLLCLLLRQVHREGGTVQQ